MALDWLLAPLTVQDFFAEVWGVADRHIQGRDPRYFEDRLSGLSTVDEILEHVRHNPSAVIGVKSSNPSEVVGAKHVGQGSGQLQSDREHIAFTSSCGATAPRQPGLKDRRGSHLYQLPDGTLDFEGVHADLANGYTIVLTKLEQYAPSLAELSNAMEVEVNCPCGVNAYISPPGSTGFPVHYDAHEVLVLQLQGSKLWHVYGDEAVAPHKLEPEQGVDPRTLPLPTDFQLTAGDTLHLPRGRIHDAETTTEPSVHLTVGLYTPTVLTLLTHTVNGLSLCDDRLFAQLPPGHPADPDVRDTMRAVLRNALAAVEEPGAIAEGLGAMADVLVQRGRIPSIEQTDDTATGVDAQSWVVKHQSLYSRVTSAVDRVALHFARSLVEATSDHESAMRFVSSSTKPFQVHNLPGLNPAQQIGLARLLINRGFLTCMTEIDTEK